MTVVANPPAHVGGIRNPLPVLAGRGDAAPMTVTRTRAGHVVDLLDRDVRAEWLLAYHPDGGVAVHEMVVMVHPDSVRWLTVVSATVSGASVTYEAVTTDGTSYALRDWANWPIVLGRPA